MDLQKGSDKGNFRQDFRKSQNFGKRNQNYGQTNGRNFSRKPLASFQSRPQHSSQSHRTSCSACGNFRCSGNPDTCFAKGKECVKCNKIGDFAQVCRSIYNTKGDKIRN